MGKNTVDGNRKPDIDKFLNQMDEDDLKALKMVVKIGPEDMGQLMDIIKFFKSIMSFSRIVRYFIVFVLGSLVALVVAVDQIANFWNNWFGTPK